MRRARLAPLRELEFRLLFTAQAIWLLGSWMTPVALAFAVLEQTDSPTALGVVLGAETLPMALLVLVGGVWADPPSFLLAAGILLGVRVDSVPREAASFRHELTDGWRAVRSRTWLVAMMLDTALWMLVVFGPYAVLGPLVCQRHLGGAGAWAL